jgi:hypothetical protein
MEQSDKGRFFRAAWITGVNTHFPGTPKAGYVSPWEEMVEWEQQAAIAVYEQVAQFVRLCAGQTKRLNREQRGRFVALCWIGQIYRHFDEPKESYVADWDALASWQQETDADIFSAIETNVQHESEGER